MMYNYHQMEKVLCESLCAEVRIVKPFNDGTRMIETPFTFPDGDYYPIYLEEIPSGGVRLTDRGHTLMHISYNMDVDSLYKSGVRNTLREQILRDTGMKENEGAFFVDCTPENLPSAIFQFGQGLGQIYDILFLSRSRATSVFYEELEKTLYEIIDEEKIEKHYVFSEISDAQNYPVDFRILKESRESDLLIFGIPSHDKAQLTTIILQYLHLHKVIFESLLIFENQEEMSPRDVAHLTNAGHQSVSSLSQREILERKITEMAA